MKAWAKIGRWLWLVPVAIVIGVAWQHLHAPHHEDEIWWTGSAYYYDLAFVRHDFRNPDWQSVAAREAPPVGRYLIGAALHLRGRLIETPDLQGEFLLQFTAIPGAWGTGEDYQKRLAMVQRMDPEVARSFLQTGETSLRRADLLTGRKLVGLFGALCVAGIYCFGRLVEGPATALLASLGASVHPAMIETYTTVSISPFALTFSVWALVAFVLLQRTLAEPGRRLRASLLTVATGLLIALAVGSKMNALIVPAVVAVFGAVALGQLLLYRTPAAGRRLVAFAVAGILAIVVFIGLDPTLYTDPIDGIAALVDEPARNMLIQATIVPTYLSAPGPRLAAIADLLCGGLIPFALLVAAVLLEAVRVFRRGDEATLLAWWVIAFALIVAWLPFPRPSYVLPLVPPTMLVAARPLVEVATLVHRRFYSLAGRSSP